MSLTYFCDLKENMINQIEVFEVVIRINILFKQAILDKNWDDVNKCINKLNQLSVEVEGYDKKRVDILIKIAESLHSKESENFYSIIKKAPTEVNESLINAFYQLKVSIIKAQGIFKGLSSFVEHKKEVSKDIIEVIVNDAKGNVYSKPGRRDLDSSGFLVNRQL